MVSAELLAMASAVVGQFVVIPLLGASFLYLCSRKVGAPSGVTFSQSWQAYFIAVCCGLGLMIGLNFVLPISELGGVGLLGLQFAVMCLAQFGVILLRLRRLSHAALLAQGCVVMLTNLVALTLMLSISQA